MFRLLFGGFEQKLRSGFVFCFVSLQLLWRSHSLLMSWSRADILYAARSLRASEGWP